MKKILLIDDVKENLELVKETIEELISDSIVLIAESGKEGLKIAKEEKPDVIISDIMMPEMDGIEVCKRLRADETTKLIPIIIHTGSKTNTETRIQCLEAGAEVFLPKPIDAGEFIAQIKVLLRVKEAEDKLLAERKVLDEEVKKRTKELQEVNKKLQQDITERKKTEQELLESEEHFKTLFNFMIDPVVIIDSKGTFVEITDKLEELTGLKREDFIGKNFMKSKITSAKYKAILIKNFAKRMMGKKVAPYEIEILSASGEKMFFEINAAKINYKGKPADMVVFRDIKERKKAGKELAESEQLNRTIIENSPIGISVRSKNGTLLLSNKAWRTLWGHIEKDISGLYKKRKKLVFDEKDSYLHDHLDDIKKIYSEGGQYFIQDIKLPKSGKNKAEWISQYFYAIKDEKGDVEKVVILTENITELKRAENIQKTLFNISNALNSVDNLHELLIKIREYLGNVIDTTNFFVALYDEKTDMISLPFHVDKKDEFEKFPAGKTMAKYVIKTGKPLFATNDVVEELTKRGIVETIGAHSEIWLGVPLKIENKVTGVIAVQSYDDPNLYSEKDIEILTFISEEIALAIQYKQAEEELKINRERLKTANSILRHDITNDLVVIKSALDIYRDENDETMLDEIEKRVEKTINTINKQREQEQFLNSHADLDEYDLEKVTHNFINSYPSMKINITGSGKVYADNALYSIFENIINNAAKHSNTETLDINISYENDYCVIRFADRGIGIPDGIKDKIFDEGYHFGKAGHTGIGLYIVRRTVEEYGGEVFVEDNKPKGAVFVVRLRRAIEVSR